VRVPLGAGMRFNAYPSNCEASEKTAWRTAYFLLGTLCPQTSRAPTRRMGRQCAPEMSMNCLGVALHQIRGPNETSHLRTSIRTLPVLPIPMARAAPLLRSIERPFTNGPRSLIRTITDRPVCEFVTRTRVPKGRVR
jgi:hypothetical protein